MTPKAQVMSTHQHIMSMREHALVCHLDTGDRRVEDIGFGERVRVEMARMELSATALATALGVSQHTVGRWRAGTVPPEHTTIVALAEALRVDPGYLLFGPPRNTAPEVAQVLIRDVLRQLDEDPDELQRLANRWAMIRRAMESENPPGGDGPPP